MRSSTSPITSSGVAKKAPRPFVLTKEQADHSLPYIVAVALIDGTVLPEQYQPERILRPDVQELLKKVTVRPVEVLSRRFPEEMPCRLTVKLKDGRELIKEKQDYEGFRGRPMQWETAAQKLHHLSGLYTDAPLRSAILEAVINLERISVAELTQLLSQVKTE